MPICLRQVLDSFSPLKFDFRSLLTIIFCVIGIRIIFDMKIAARIVRNLISYLNDLYDMFEKI